MYVLPLPCVGVVIDWSREREKMMKTARNATQR